MPNQASLNQPRESLSLWTFHSPVYVRIGTPMSDRQRCCFGEGPEAEAEPLVEVEEKLPSWTFLSPPCLPPARPVQTPGRGSHRRDCCLPGAVPGEVATQDNEEPSGGSTSEEDVDGVKKPAYNSAILGTGPPLRTEKRLFTDGHGLPSPGRWAPSRRPCAATDEELTSAL